MGLSLSSEQLRVIGEIKRLKSSKNAICLVHNYQRAEIYEIADFIGDSFALSKEAAKTSAKIIVFCGVRFMVESAKILSPEKMVLLPSLSAGCPLADTITVHDLRKIKAEHPDAAVVAYVNTSADVKAESDICCTSANAIKIVNSLPQRGIIFVPDCNMARWVELHTKKEIIRWPGYCYVHSNILYDKIREAKRLHPDARLLAHPECEIRILKMADGVLGTEGMLEYARKSESREFIIATEEGMVYKLQRELPNKKFYAAGGVCFNQKMIHLEDVYESLKKEQYEIDLDKDIITKARNALDKMLAAGREQIER